MAVVLSAAAADSRVRGTRTRRWRASAGKHCCYDLESEQRLARRQSKLGTLELLLSSGGGLLRLLLVEDLVSAPGNASAADRHSTAPAGNARRTPLANRFEKLTENARLQESPPSDRHRVEDMPNSANDRLCFWAVCTSWTTRRRKIVRYVRACIQILHCV